MYAAFNFNLDDLCSLLVTIKIVTFVLVLVFPPWSALPRAAALQFWLRHLETSGVGSAIVLELMTALDREDWSSWSVDMPYLFLCLFTT